MATEIANRDWISHPLGEPEDWPDTLKDTLNLILKSGFSTLILWGKDFITFYNDAFAPVISHRSDALGHPLAEVFPKVWDKLSTSLLKALAGEPTFHENFKVSVEQAEDGRESWWTFSVSPITDRMGDVVGVYLPVHDVTSRVLAKMQLREAQRNFEVVNDIVPSMLWRLSPNVGLTWQNRQMLSYFGPRDRADWVHPDDQRSRALEWERANREGSAFNHSHRLLNADGEYRWHFVRSEPHHDDDGNIIEWVGCSTDIHDMRMANDALAESQSLFTGFASNSTDALWIADLETGNFEYVNPAFRNIWGTPDASKPFTWDDWLCAVHADDRGLRDSARESLRSGQVLRDEYRIVRSDGSIRWIRETSFPIVAGDRTIRKAGGIAQDITADNRMVVHLIDTDTPSRNSLSRKLQMSGYQVRSFADVDTFFRYSRALLPGCVVLFDHDDGEEARRVSGALKDQARRLPLVLIRDLADTREAVDLMKLGVSDILAPSELEAGLERAVATALATMQISTKENHAVREAQGKLQTLTDRERQILNGLCEGSTNKMIARDIGLSPRTIETYRIRILERLGVTTIAEAVKISAIASI